MQQQPNFGTDIFTFDLPPVLANFDQHSLVLTSRDVDAGANDFVPIETTQGVQSGSAGALSAGTSKVHPFGQQAKRRRRGAGPEVNGMSMKDIAEQLATQIAAEPVDVSCPAGFQVTAYNGDISQHYTLPSETVQITRGSIKYVDHHARYGPQTRFRFQLCHNYLQRKCTKLSECSYIHATVLPKPSEVHLNPFAPRRLAADRHGRSNDVIPSHFDDPSIADGYPTLPAGFVITVHPPQGNQTSNELTSVPSDMIIKTVGGDLIFAAYKDNGGEEPSNLTPDQLPRHCTKFQYRRVCTSGTECPFIHSKVPFPGTWIGIATTVPATTTAPIPPPSAPMQPPTTSVAPGLLPPGAVFAPAPHPPTFVSAPPNLGYAPQQMFYMPTVPLDQTMGVPGPQTWPQPAPFVQPAPAAMVMAPPPPQHPYMFSQPPAGVQYFVMMPPQ